jgi:hypothetical protein
LSGRNAPFGLRGVRISSSAKAPGTANIIMPRPSRMRKPRRLCDVTTRKATVLVFS